MEQDEINQRFGFHRATIEGPEATQPKHVLLRRAYLAFVSDLNRLLPDGREKSLALTDLENAAMWSHKSIAKAAPLEVQQEPTEIHTEDTLPAVLDCLVEAGMNVAEGRETIQQMLNKGLLFRQINRQPVVGE